MENTEGKKNLKPVIAVGAAALILVIIGIITVARKSSIPDTAHHNGTVITPTLLPTIPKTLDDKLKSLQDDSVVIDKSFDSIDQ